MAFARVVHAEAKLSAVLFVCLLVTPAPEQLDYRLQSIKIDEKVNSLISK